MLHDLDLPSEGSFDPLAEATFLVSAIGLDQLQTQEAALKRSHEQFAAVVVLDVGLIHLQQEPEGHDEQMALKPFHAFAAIVSWPPPFDSF
jgi:hypothetical protein